MIKHLKKMLGKYDESVVFYGHKPFKEVHNSFLKSCLAIFPSFQEAFSLVPLESMSHACPTIYTKLTSGKEVITNNIDGLLIDPHNINEVFLAIRRLFDDIALAKKLSKEGYKKVAKKFNIQKLKKNNEQLFYQTIINFKKIVVRYESHLSEP